MRRRSRNRTGRRDRIESSPLRRAIAAVTGLTIGAASVLAAAPAFAAPEFEITARWATDVPDVVASGDVVTAEWRVNVNDDAAAPSNDPVDDMNFTLTAVNGVFRTLPDVCLTSGVDPVSAISPDGTSLLCNLGTQDQGQAFVVQTPIQVDGATGDELSASGTIDGHDAGLPPIGIENPFLMDMAWQSAVSGVTTGTDTVDASFQWTLFLGNGSDPGPDSVTYTLDLDTDTGDVVSVAPDACSAFTAGAAPGHPWSGGDHPVEQLAPFVDDCTLTPTGTPGRFRLTLSGIDYSLLQAPTGDSAGGSLPADRVAVASGSVAFRVMSAANNTITLSASAPTYTATTGATSTDDAANNTSSKVWTTGGWSSAWQPGATGYSTPSWWSDQFRVSPGAQIRSIVAANQGKGALPGTDLMSQCVVLDTKYVEYDSAQHLETWEGPAIDSDMEWYVGGATALDPASAGYDPNAFRCADDPAGWVDAEPADLSTVRAVRVTYPFSEIAGFAPALLAVLQTVKDDVAIGQDIWMFGEMSRNGTPYAINRSTDPADGGLLTPDARYPFTVNGRDIVRIVGVTPALEKSVDRTSVRPGEPAGYTLTYSANSAEGLIESVDDFQIVDTLPLGVHYVSGSASPEPAVSTDDEGREVLTWVLDAVPTNTRVPLTYQAAADDTVTPGQRLTNSAVASVMGESTTAATAQTTISTNGRTTIGKTADTPFIPNLAGDGVGDGSWTVTLRSFDPVAQDFTDTIDILPYLGDERGTEFSGTYEVTGVEAGEAAVYYTTADPATLSDDPADASNGSAGSVVGNTVGWTTEFMPDATAVRVIGGELASGATQQFTVGIATDGALGGDVFVNRAQARDGHTELVMRTSSPMTVANHYSASLKKYVQDVDGVWHDANTVEDYPTFPDGATVRYRIVVENTGQGTLTGIQVSDDLHPELGSFLVDELAPGESETHEYEAVASGDAGDTVVNNACAVADVPVDSGVAPTINCDPAGIEVEGTPTHTKTILSADPVGGGLWEVRYRLEVTNASTASTVYSLADELHFTGQAEVLESAITELPDGVAPAEPAWDGIDRLDIATDVPLPGNDDADYSPHVYLVRVLASVPLELDDGVGGAAASECPADGADDDTAFNNTSALTDADGDVETDQACAPPPSLRIVKSLSGAVTPVDGEPGHYDAAYEVTVTNSGAGAGVYDLDDRLEPGDGVTVVGVQSVTSDAPEPEELNAGFDGIDDVRIVTGQPIAGAAGGVPVVHTYTVVVRYAADLVGIQPPSAEECLTGDGSARPGTLGNTATVGSNDLQADDDACLVPGHPTVDKAVVSADPIGDGQWRVVYDLTVGNVGTEPTTYDLDDEFLFAEAVEVEDVTVTGPDGVAVNGAFDGAADQRIATDVALEGLDDSGYQPHVYRVTVTVSVPLHFDESLVADDGTGSPACTEPAGGDHVHQGLNNAATLTDEAGGTQVDTDCAGVPSIEIAKVIDGEPVPGSDGRWRVRYAVTVTNDGAATGRYTLRDELRYGTGVEVLSASVTEAPDGVTPAASWTGQGQTDAVENVIASDVPLAAGSVHTYRVLVEARLDTDTADATAVACPDPGSDDRGGFANTAGMSHNGLSAEASACDVPEWPEDVPPLAQTGGTVALGVLAAGLVLLLGGGLLVARRRRLYSRE